MIINTVISENMSEFMGYPIQDFRGELLDPANIAYRVGLSDPEPATLEGIRADLERLLQDPKVSELRALIISEWSGAFEQGEPSWLLQRLIESKLPQLQIFFLGDQRYQQCEISWIHLCDLSPFLDAYPGLLHLGVRGAIDLSFRALTHDNLQSLIVESGGLREQTVREICSLSLPSLERLEIWLGNNNYNDGLHVKALEQLWSGERLPRLRRLGLRNSMFTDEICEALLGAPIMESLSSLDLSMGTFSDKGAEHLLANPSVRKLIELDVGHHFLSEEMQSRLKQELSGVSLHMDAPQGAEGERYCSVSE